MKTSYNKRNFYSPYNYVPAIFIALVTLFLSCRESGGPTLFEFIAQEQSNILFSNNIIESDSFNILSHEFMYNGGGVGVGDFNSDGLFDLYFTGNEVPNRLYLNRGDFIFEDVTEIAGIAAPDIWSSGVAVVDINSDALPDIYVSATFREDIGQRTNKLFINQGNDDDGNPTFLEQANQYGLADTSYTTQTYFFDYDNDGDLDAFLLNDKLFRPRSTTDLKLLMAGGEATVDKFLENNGDNFFIDVSKEVGITFPGFGLGAAMLDVNSDGFLDIYVSNDFISNDLLYVNQGNGTFKNLISKYFKHQSFSSMGIDASDLNGDGIEEVMTLDMLPNDRAKVKRTYAFHKYQFYDLMKETGYAMQYNRNSLQLSNPSGFYSEIGQLAGVDATEWSWSILFADLDNDALKDIAITNGYPRDITDMDFTDYNTGIESMMDSKSELLSQIPIVKAKNYFYKNVGEYNFSDKSEEWGISHLTFSNGAATVDLDNDGDLDYVVNNINDPAHIYKNNTSDRSANHFLRVLLKGDQLNTSAIGAKVVVYHNGQRSTQLNMPQRGYVSSVEPVMHFGMGSILSVDSIIVYWTDNRMSVLKNIATNQLLTIEKIKSLTSVNPQQKKSTYMFDERKIQSMEFRHKEIDFYDYNFQGLLPRLHSREGPGIAVGDLNGDEYEDLVIGNGSKQNTHVFLTREDGGHDKILLDDVALSEDMGILIFDADLDGNNDLYIVSGSTEFRNGSGYYNDKFYRNDGNGNLTFEPEFIPHLSSSGASVSAADYDADGDLDLFVAGRIEAQQYPLATDSYILTNEIDSFVNTPKLFPNEVSKLGMVTTGLWTDFNNDGWMDLIVVGEWMPIKVFTNDKGHLTGPLELPHSSGWWNSITGADLDGDGDIDYVLGNQGLNNKVHLSKEHPLIIYAQDFDKNGSIDPVITEYDDGDYYPVHLKMNLLNQLNFLKKNFSTYESYSNATIDQLIQPDSLAVAKKYIAETFESAILWNDKGAFRIEALPIEAQFAPVYGSLCLDADLDGDQDILLVGNRYNTEVFEGQHDALNGVFLVNDGEGKFRYSPIDESGFEVSGDARSLVRYFNSKDESLIMASVNNDSLRIFQSRPADKQVVVKPLTNENRAIIFYNNGQTISKEFYWGSSFLSQSSRNFVIDSSSVRRIDFYTLNEVSRTMKY